MTAMVFRPTAFPRSTMVRAKRRASSIFFIKAPSPTVTSKRIASAPAAIFLLMTELAIKGMVSTVAVTSRRAYKSLSAFTSWSDCPMTDKPISCTCWINSSWVRSIWKPLMDSNLSMVPPVWPKPRPLILATGTPKLATKGTKTKVTLSPTPPVECLSTLIPGIADRSNCCPVWTIFMVI